MLQWYWYCFKKAFTFRRRASRTEYWTFTIANIVILALFWVISTAVDVPMTADAQDVFPKDPVLSVFFGTLYLFFNIAIFFPSLAVTIRRLHDRNHTGFWVIATLIPILNFVVLIFMLLPSQPFANYYGLRAPRTPFDNVPEASPNIYGPYGNITYQNPLNNQMEGNQTMDQTQQNIPTNEPQADSLMAEMEEKNKPESATPNSENHRPMQAEESSIVARMKKLSQK